MALEHVSDARIHADRAFRRQVSADVAAARLVIQRMEVECWRAIARGRQEEVAEAQAAAQAAEAARAEQAWFDADVARVDAEVARIEAALARITRLLSARPLRGV